MPCSTLGEMNMTLVFLDGNPWHSNNSWYLSVRKPLTWKLKNILKNYRPQGSTLTFKAACPVRQVRLKVYLSCMKWHLSTQLYMLLSSDYWPVLLDKCHYNATCPRSNFSKFVPVRDGRTKLKVEPWATYWLVWIPLWFQMVIWIQQQLTAECVQHKCDILPFRQL